jgi:hypothetical protein
MFDGQTPPVEITGEGMREAIFARDANWVENVGNLTPILRADERPGSRELRIYTQRDVIWVYNLDTKKWSSINVVKDANGNGSDVFDYIFFRNRFYLLAATNGPVREDVTGTLDEVYNAGVQQYDVTAEVFLHPFEAVPMTDMLIESIEIHHEITGDQTGSTLEAAVSFDRGATFPREHTVIVPITTDDEPIRIPLWQAAANLVVRLRHKGKAGEGYFNAFWAGAWVQPLGEETNDSIPATVSASLS